MATGLFALGVYHAGTVGLAAGLGINLLVRYLIKRQADVHETTYHGSTHDAPSEIEVDNVDRLTEEPEEPK